MAALLATRTVVKQSGGYSLIRICTLCQRLFDRLIFTCVLVEQHTARPAFAGTRTVNRYTLPTKPYGPLGGLLWGMVISRRALAEESDTSIFIDEKSVYQRKRAANTG